jgi:pimeloyl-ACP methyl ester carboxylesterase
MTARCTDLGLCLLAAGALAACGSGNQRSEERPMENSDTQVAARSISSKDGTRIAYDRQGQGPALILIGGALSDRAGSVPLAGMLASDFTVISFDRRGRGDSGDTKPYAVAREVEDIAALIDAAGGRAHLVGFSSGAALALEAAAALGPKVGKLAIYEAPYDEAEGAADKWRRYRTEQAELLAAGRGAEAVEHHLKFVGVPEPAMAQMKASPMWQGMTALAPTLPYDVAVIGEDRSVPVERAARVSAEALVMDGGANRETMPFMRASADRIAGAIPNARRRTIEGEGHNVSPDAIVPVLVEFLSGN